MAVIDKLIVADDSGISFGNYELEKKTKLDKMEYNGDIYKVKTFKEITRLEKNGMFVYESVPGTSVHRLKVTENKVSFTVEGVTDVSITLELQEDCEYILIIDNEKAGKINTGLSGKLSFGVELDKEKEVDIVIEQL